MGNNALIGDRQIRMVIHEGYRIPTDTMAEIDETARREHFRGEIGRINIGMLTAPLVAMWAKTQIIRIAIKRNRIILISRGVIRRAKCYRGKPATVVPQVSWGSMRFMAGVLTRRLGRRGLPRESYLTGRISRRGTRIILRCL